MNTEYSRIDDSWGEEDHTAPAAPEPIRRNTPPQMRATQKTKMFESLPLSPQSNDKTKEDISYVCDEIKCILLAKNQAYGDSALNPVRVFSKASSEEQLLVRIDDKLSRLARGGDLGEDVLLDLIGYLVLLRVARTR